MRVWYVSIAFAGAGLLSVLFEENLVTREEKDASQFELEDHTDNTGRTRARVPQDVNNQD